MSGGASEVADPVEPIAAAFLSDWRAGKRPAIDDVAARHPAHAERIRALFPVLLLVEGLKPDAPPAGPPALTRVGEFEIVREIGRGGMGVVYEARQASIGRRVALKVLLGAGGDARRRARFAREVEAIGRLHHTNIVPVFGAGEADGSVYYAMQYIDGRGLDDALAELGPCTDGGRGAAGVAVQVADALAHAHEHGVLHRDIKPANLLLTADGTVWVTDFGLAKLGADAGLTRPGEVVGTLRYMAPEQLDSRFDARGDVFALGLVLYALVCGRPAYDASDRGRLIEQIAAAAPPRPGGVVPGLDRDLEMVLRTALAPDPDRRYPTARALADDLRRVLAGRPVRVRRVPLAERAWRACRRHPGGAAAALVATLSLSMVAAVSTSAYWRTRAALARASQQTQRATQARTQAEQARLRGELERHRARAEQRRAEHNLRLALAAFDEVFERATRPLSTDAAPVDEGLWLPPVVAGSTGEILVALLGFYDRLDEANAGDAALRAQLARAHERVAGIMRLLGRYGDAEYAARRALAYHAGPTADRRTVARLELELGRITHATGRPESAGRHYDAAIAAARAQLTATADRPARLLLAHALRASAALLREQGGPTGFHRSREVLEVLEPLKGDADPALRHLRACAYRDLRGRHGRMPAGPQRRMLGYDAVGRAIALLEALVREHPERPQYRFDLAQTYALAAHGEMDTAAREQQLKKALTLVRSLATAHRDVPAYHGALARTQLDMARVIERTRGPQAAEPLLREATTLQSRLVERYPAISGYRLYRAHARSALARCLSRLQRAVEALPLLQGAIDDTRAYLARNPRVFEARRLLPELYRQLAAELDGLGHGDGAASARRDEAAARAALEETRGRFGRPGFGRRSGPRGR